MCFHQNRPNDWLDQMSVIWFYFCNCVPLASETAWNRLSRRPKHFSIPKSTRKRFWEWFAAEMVLELHWNRKLHQSVQAIYKSLDWAKHIVCSCRFFIHSVCCVFFLCKLVEIVILVIALRCNSLNNHLETDLSLSLALSLNFDFVSLTFDHLPSLERYAYDRSQILYVLP